MLDIAMPGRIGLEVLEDVKAMRPKLPVLVLSMHSEDQYRQASPQSGSLGLHE